MTNIYDSIIIGGGPAGLSASIYLGRALKRPLILDKGEGRTAWNQKNDNYFGFPNGIRSQEFVKRGRAQAARFGVEFRADTAKSIERDTDNFRVLLQGDDELHARTLIFATGVTRPDERR